MFVCGGSINTEEDGFHETFSNILKSEDTNLRMMLANKAEPTKHTPASTYGILEIPYNVQIVFLHSMFNFSSLQIT